MGVLSLLTTSTIRLLFDLTLRPAGRGGPSYTETVSNMASPRHRTDLCQVLLQAIIGPQRLVCQTC